MRKFDWKRPGFFWDVAVIVVGVCAIAMWVVAVAAFLEAWGL